MRNKRNIRDHTKRDIKIRWAKKKKKKKKFTNCFFAFILNVLSVLGSQIMWVGYFLLYVWMTMSVNHHQRPFLTQEKPYMTFFFLMNTIRIILINILTHLSFIIAVNGTNEYEAQECASIHYKRTPHGIVHPKMKISWFTHP